jgi:hypothetical protein
MYGCRTLKTVEERRYKKVEAGDGREAKAREANGRGVKGGTGSESKTNQNYQNPLELQRHDVFMCGMVYLQSTIRSRRRGV